MSSYNGFADIYDSLMTDVDYAGLCDFMLEICKMHNHTPKLALDAACGTGSFTKHLDSHVDEVIGVDCSEDMLAVAKEKMRDTDCLLLCQDLCELDLYGTIDTAFCTLDGFNHITDMRLLKKALKKISLFTEPGGLLIFDVNTVYKHKNTLANNTFAIDNDDLYLVWQNYLCENNIININLDFFIKKGRQYEKYNENFDERAYTDEQWRDMLSYAGYKIIGKYDFDTHYNVRKTSDKIIYAAEKI